MVIDHKNEIQQQHTTISAHMLTISSDLKSSMLLITISTAAADPLCTQLENTAHCSILQEQLHV